MLECGVSGSVSYSVLNFIFHIKAENMQDIEDIENDVEKRFHTCNY